MRARLIPISWRNVVSCKSQHRLGHRQGAGDKAAFAVSYQFDLRLILPSPNG
jgi:hypothetical protein